MYVHVKIILTVIISSIQRIDGHFGISSELTSKTHINREELIEFIKSLNDDEHQLDVLASNNLEHPDVGENKKEEKLKEMLWLLKKNYDAYKHHAYVENNPKHTGARLYLIKNPDILDEYTTYLKNNKKEAKTASSGDLSEQEVKLKSIKDMLQALRRNSRIARRNPGRINDNGSDNNNFAREQDVEIVPDKEVENAWGKVGIKKDSESLENKRYKNKYDNEWADEKPIAKHPKYQDDWNVKKNYKNKYESSDREKWDKDQGSREFKKSIESPRYNKYWDSYGGGREPGGRGAGIGRQRERSYPQGRTPIPIVGKRGIYENE